MRAPVLPYAPPAVRRSVRGPSLAVSLAVSQVVSLAACQQTGVEAPDSSVCEDEVSTAQTELQEASDTGQSFTAVDRVLTAEDAEDNFRGCGGTTGQINAARAVTCQYLAMTLPDQFTPAVAAVLRQRCCPSTAAGLQPWCAGFDAGYMF